MNKNYMVSLIAVIVLFLIAYVGTQQGAGLQLVFGIIVPYLAVALFVVGFVRRVLSWSRSAVPFRITHHLRAAALAALVQTGQNRQPLNHPRRRHPDVSGDRLLPVAVPQHPHAP